ncbi:MAG TPA: methylmalonyl Co-A mutase-associated GTPase MeaB [Syntrophorhabdus sp.]|nr:methylmalonyl Co-A mutase-associated GTPase MeaB [Syntrophorhabdus sp.]
MGVTGAPGAGKSTIVDKLAISFGRQGGKVGIIAVDPTSAKGSGAFLGDRLRMRNAEKLEGVFIRSMAHRGFPGGIAKATLGAAYVLEGLGKDVILIESVGSGQTEIQISMICDSVVTVLTPDYGDEIQLMKAGLLEIGDIVVMNKTDRPGAVEAAKDIEFYLMSHKKQHWQIPVLTVEAIQGKGVEDLIAALKLHRTYTVENSQGSSKKKENIKRLVLAIFKEEFWGETLKKIQGKAMFDDIFQQLQNSTIDPYKAVRMVMDLALPTE